MPPSQWNTYFIITIVIQFERYHSLWFAYFVTNLDSNYTTSIARAQGVGAATTTTVVVGVTATTTSVTTTSVTTTTGALIVGVGN